MNISSADLRKALTETNLEASIQEINKTIDRPPAPPMPEGVPANFREAQFCPGDCAIPLWNGTTWHFVILSGGMPIRDTRDNDFIRFDTYTEAIQMLKEWRVWQKTKAKS